MTSLPRTDQPHAGMPVLDASADQVSWFEFANASLFYTPVYLFAFALMARHGGIRNPIVANPGIPFSGLVGESKTIVLDQMKGESRDLIAAYKPVLRWTGDGGADRTFEDAKAAMAELGLAYPIVVKPDLGMRGAGVQVAKSDEDLRRYGANFPAGAKFLVQEMINEEGEAGVFYVRHPDWETGRIISLTLKYFPRVEGDGKRTLRALIAADPRAGKLPHLYLKRFEGRLDTVVPRGEKIRLAFAGNHSKGTIFRNGTDLVTEAMVKRFDSVAADMGEFYVGRFDIRFGDFSALQSGHGFKILEVNGAGGESTHIWDSRMTLRGAYKALFAQFSHIFQIGAKNRKRGFKPDSYHDFFRAMSEERRLTRDYPVTH